MTGALGYMFFFFGLWSSSDESNMISLCVCVCILYLLFNRLFLLVSSKGEEKRSIGCQREV